MPQCLSRLKPVGELQIAAAGAPKGQLTGEQVYNQVCKTCHEAGLAGAPKVGDKAAWGKVIAQGQKTAVEHAINGIRAMPPKGGNPDFENVEVERAVVFMASKAGANWKEPAATAAPAASCIGRRRPRHDISGSRLAKPPCSTTAVAAAAPAAAKARRQEGLRHDVHGVPRDRRRRARRNSATRPRGRRASRAGIDALYTSALKGKAAMPAKGGNTALSDADVKAAVDYMAAPRNSSRITALRQRTRQAAS